MPDLTSAEQRVRDAFVTGARVVFGPGTAKRDRTVRGEVLTALLTGPAPAGLPALRLVGAHVVGLLRLEGARVRHVVDLRDCVFEQPPDLRMARLTGLRLRGCRMPGLRGRNLRVGSDLVLEAGFTSDGVVDLTDAAVRGTVRLAGAVLRGGDHALLAARIRVSGSMQAIALRATGEVRLRGANFGGNVHLGGARLINPGQDALEATGVQVAGTLFCDAEGGRFTAEGRVLLPGARVGGDVVFSGARLRSSAVDRPVLVIPRGTADEAASLVADRVRVDGNVELDDGFTASGTVRLPGAEVGGYLRLSGAVIGRPEALEVLDRADEHIPVALHADGMVVRGDLEARGAVDGGFRGDGARESALRVYGQVRLVDAHVRGSASLSGVRLHGPGIDVLFADRLRVGGTLFLRELRAEGSLRLQNAEIGSTLDCAGAVLERPRRRPDGSVKPSLDARVATVGKDLLCDDGFHAAGGVRVRLAEVGKMANFAGARLGGPAGGIALNAYGLTVPQLVLRLGEDRVPEGRVLLTRARATAVYDGPGLWAATGGVAVEDFTFTSIDSTPPVDVGTRLRWLRRVQPDFAPGPYEQLAAVYRDGGEEELAQRVQLEKQHRRYSELGWAGRVWGFLQRWTVGYGYRPWLAIAWLTAFWLVGSLWFAGHEMTRLNEDEVPVWNPWLLSVDLLVPIVDLGHDGKWRFTGASQWISSTLIAVGWILASTAAAGAARVLKRI
ncbi:pentapeptide repeat-containing protein [Saccharothrix coeruleofusca]|uniref:Oxidoreductase n=1 Tax=Saccharothrix coeruleofusca TaxID=33919 RepID=A0A918AI19_9PSEU|nr:pentapeptide repeat-containing protein [Saccharothrix coeruleofusca]GGP38735.1 oxidoreductase [Saccharothrix coeruleofusca]